MQERPPVTVTDPGGEDGPGDVIGTDAPRSRRTPVVLGIAAAVVATGALAVDVVGERRESGERERRLRSEVSLTYTPQFLVGVDADRSTSDATGAARVLRYPYGVRNTGSRDVVVERATLGPLVSDREVVVPAGRSARVELLLRVPCDGGDPPGQTPGAARLRVRAADGGTQELRLPAGLGSTSLRRAVDRACGEQLARYTVVPYVGIGVLERDRVVAPAYWGNSEGRDASLRSLAAGPGMHAELQDRAGRPVPLPVALPATGPAVEHRLVLTVQACDALVLDDAPEDANDRPTTLRTVVRDEQRAAARPSLPAEDVEELVTSELPRVAVRRLVEASCPG